MDISSKLVFDKNPNGVFFYAFDYIEGRTHMFSTNMYEVPKIYLKSSKWHLEKVNIDFFYLPEEHSFYGKNKKQENF